MLKSISEVDRKTICEWAQADLWEDNKDSKEALAYLVETRGLSQEVIKRFRFGYIPREVKHELAGRLIMPLFDGNERLIALTTRDFRQAKSSFSHWHESFDKRRYLFGINVAKQHIIKYNKVLVVEGQFDTTVLHAHNVYITVGQLGSAFSLEHIAVLRRYCTEIYLLNDADDAGYKNTKRSMDIYKENELRRFGISMYPCRLEKYTKLKDPDEFVRTAGTEAVIEMMKKEKEEFDVYV